MTARLRWTFSARPGDGIPFASSLLVLSEREGRSRIEWAAGPSLIDPRIARDLRNSIVDFFEVAVFADTRVDWNDAKVSVSRLHSINMVSTTDTRHARYASNDATKTPTRIGNGAHSFTAEAFELIDSMARWTVVELDEAARTWHITDQRRAPCGCHNSLFHLRQQTIFCSSCDRTPSGPLDQPYRA